MSDAAITGSAVASQRIAGALREEILGGRYLPGERIRQEDIAARYGASRIPVREALAVLAAEGLVTLVANAGAWVTRLSAAECAEAYLIRERLEPLLLRMSLPLLEEAAIGRMGELATEMEGAVGQDGGSGTRGGKGGTASAGVDAFLRADREFHLASYCAADEGETGRIIHRMWNVTQHYRREFSRRAAGGAGAGLAVTHMEHRLLVDCARRRDPDDAERVLLTHIRRTRLELARHPEIFT
ncbi:MAG: GntR family transcriptional regulator [Actinomycetia bacterium]|nr:GntR family transcriptional regulator [Actinomycetes bacterium]